jgi:hypothetical protein
MHSVSFTSSTLPKQTTPTFAGDRHQSRPTRNFEPMEFDAFTHRNNPGRDVERQQPEDHRSLGSAMSRAAKKTLKYTVAPLVVTSPLWVPLLGVGVACNNNAPEGAIAKIKPVAGSGPAVADALCPSVFVMPNGDLIKNDPPSWTSFTNKVGHVYKNGLVTSRDKVEGAFKDGKYYDGGLIKGLQTAQIASNDPENFEITVTQGAAASKTVDQGGTVKNALKHNGFHQKQGSVKLIGPYQGKALKDVPKEDREMIKAAAAAHSKTWAG